MKTIHAVLLILIFLSTVTLAQDFPLAYIEGLPDKRTDAVPPAHAYILEQHNRMCVATAVTRAGERMLEYDGDMESRYIVAWTHNAGRNVANEYKPGEIGMYGSDAALAIAEIGFLRWNVLPQYMQRELKGNPLTQFDWGDGSQWKTLYKKYDNVTDKYPVAEPTNTNEIALCLRKGLPVLFISSAKWKPIRIQNVDGKGGSRLECGTTQFNTTEAHVVCLRDYFTLPLVKDGNEYPVEYCHLINSHGEPPLPLKLIWLDWIQKDNKFTCFTILPKTYNQKLQ